MSVIEDSRKVLQDFIAPELRAIAVRLDALEKRFDGFEKRVDQRFDEAERRSEKRHDALHSAMQQIIDYNSIQQRLAKLESKEAAHQ